MQIDPVDPWWAYGGKLAEQGLLFAVLVGFILANYLRKIAWGREVTALEAKIAQLEQRNAEMMDIIKANSLTTTAAVDGFRRALDETQHVRDELLHERTATKDRRRT